MATISRISTKSKAPLAFWVSVYSTIVVNALGFFKYGPRGETFRKFLRYFIMETGENKMVSYCALQKVMTPSNNIGIPIC